MGKTYQRAKADTTNLLADVAAQHHPELADAQVTVGVLFAFADEGPAVEHNGYPALAVVEINNLKRRAQGLPDAVVTVDAASWADLTDARRRSLLDHELQHLEVARDKEGGVKEDDLGRPVLKLRKHDYQVGGFVAVARRHGEDSHEVAQLADIRAVHGQVLMPWGDERPEKRPARKASVSPAGDLAASPA